MFQSLNHQKTMFCNFMKTVGWTSKSLTEIQWLAKLLRLLSHESSPRHSKWFASANESFVCEYMIRNSYILPRLDKI